MTAKKLREVLYTVSIRASEKPGNTSIVGSRVSILKRESLNATAAISSKKE